MNHAPSSSFDAIPAITWNQGQHTLYAPAPLWKRGANEVVVLDTDELGSAVEVRERPEFGAAEEFVGS